MSTPEPPPHVGAGLLRRGAICGLLIVLLAAGSVSAAGFRMNVRGMSMSGIPRICSRMSPGSWLGR